MDRLEKTRKEKDNLKKWLAEEYGIVGHDKLDKCFELAWEYGHSYGQHEVSTYFDELVELIR